MNRMKLVFGGVVAVVALAALPNFAHAQQARLEARLTATAAEPLASGKARFEMRGNRIRFTTQVEDVRTATAVQVRVNNVVVGQVAIAFGGADLNLDSQLGHVVPILRAGDIVTVYNMTTGEVILGGVLR